MLIACSSSCCSISIKRCQQSAMYAGYHAAICAALLLMIKASAIVIHLECECSKSAHPSMTILDPLRTVT